MNGDEERLKKANKDEPLILELFYSEFSDRFTLKEAI